MGFANRAFWKGLRGVLDLVRVWRHLHRYNHPRRWSLKPFSREFRTGARYFSQLGIEKVDTIIDVGAYNGRFLFPALTYLEPDFALAVEPLPDIAELLEQTATRRHTPVEIYAGALWDAQGSANFSRGEYLPTSSLLTPRPEFADVPGRFMKGPGHRTKEWIEVPTTTLDTLTSAYGLTSVDLIKIDAQGAERRIIKGGTQTLSHTKYLIIELLFYKYYKEQAEFAELDRLLRECGLQLAMFYRMHRDGRHGPLRFCDALYVQSTPSI